MKIWMKNFLYTVLLLMTVTVFSMLFLYFVMPKYYQMRQTQFVTEEVRKFAEKCEGLPLAQTKEFIKNNKSQQLDDIEKEQKEKSTQDSASIIENVSLFSGQLNLVLLDQKKNIIYPDPYETQVVTYPKDTSDEEERKILDTQVERIFQENLLKIGFKDDQKQTYYIGTFLTLQPITDASRILLELSPVILIFTLSIGSIAALFYSRSSTKRIRELSETTNKMMSLDSSIHCDDTGQDEIALLAKDINHLNQNLVSTIDVLEGEIKKVEEVERSKAYFVQSASHELKTPVTIMSGLIEGMRLNIGRYKDHNKYLLKCQELLEEQSHLIKEMTTIYRLEMIDEKKNQSVIHLDKLITEIVTPYKLVSEHAEKHFDLQLTKNDLIGNEVDIKRILSNIIGNAYNYAKENGKIIIRLSDNRIQVENECKPLSPEVLQKVFEPFYRPDYARNRRDGGTGLGLFIVKKIAEKNGYHYTFVPTPNHESMIFTVDFTPIDN